MLEPVSPSRGPHLAEHHVLGHKFRVARWPAVKAGSSRPLLFYTGIGANIELLAPFLERLDGRDVITFDVPGTGGTQEFARPYRLSTMADAAGRILSELGCDLVDVMGVSWGGMLAQEFAYRHREKVGRLVLAATAAGFPMIPGRLSTTLKMLGSHRYTRPGSAEPYLQTLYGGSGQGLDTYASRMTAPSPTGYLHQLLAICGWTSVLKLTRVTAQTLILMGEKDRLVPAANGYILRFLLENARLEIIKDAGHLFALTHAPTVSSMIEDFLNNSSQPETAASIRAEQRLLPAGV